MMLDITELYQIKVNLEKQVLKLHGALEVIDQLINKEQKLIESEEERINEENG